MGAIQEGKVLIGTGFVSIGDKHQIKDYANFTVELENKTIQYACSDSYDDKTINIGRNIKGSIEFRKLTMGILHKLVGGSLTELTANSMKHYNETFSVPASPGPYTVDLTNTPLSASGDDTLQIFSEDSSKTRVYWEKVTAGAEAEFKYSISGATLTFVVADTEKSLYADYMYLGSSDASGISFGGSSDELPGTFTLRGVIKAQTEDNTLHYLGFYAKACKITSSIPLGGVVQEVSTVKADFDVIVENAGDCWIRLED